MPATGLQDVKQKIGVDYDDGYQKIANDARVFADAAREAKNVLGEYIISSRDAQRAQVDLRNELSLLARTIGNFGNTELRQHIQQVNEARDGYNRLAEASRQQAEIIKDLGDAHADTNVAIAKGADALEGYRKRLTAVRQEAEAATVSVQNVQKATGDYLARSLAGRGDSSAAQAAIAAAAAAGPGGGGGGGGGGWAAAAAAAAAGRGGGGGGGFVPWAGGGWQAVRFWGMMTAEVGATVVPALAAAGAAALVGMQSVEAMIPRYKAIAAASESIGQAYGMTTGKFLGGSSALQNAQNAFQGGGYTIAGNLLSIIQGGAGKGFINLGEQTLGMLTRGTSAMALDFTQGGVGKKLSDALGGGTQYLRQFGDVFGNLGTTLLNTAPNLPGVGADLLSTLVGGTGLLAAGSRNIPGPLMKGFLTYEAASRWLPALLGGQGLIGRMLGLKGVGGLGGLISRGGIALGGLGAPGGMLEGLGLGISGFGEGLAGLAGWPAALALAGGTMEWQALDRAGITPWGTKIAGLQQNIAGAGFTGAWKPLAHAVTTAAMLQATAPAYAAPTQQQLVSKEGPGLQAAYALSQGQQAAVALNQFANQTGELTGAAPLLVKALQKAGLKGVSFADALQIGQNALLDMTHAFGKDGKLTATAQQAVYAYAKVIAPMTQSPGAFGAAVGAQTIMSQGAMQQLSKVNAAMDAYQQIIAAGPTGASALAAGAGATLVPGSGPGGKGSAAATIAKGLAGYSSAANAAAWQAFASTSTATPGFITQLQSFGDQMRTYLTLGTASLGQTRGFSAAEMARILPQARQSPAALAMLMQQGAAAGVTGYYDTSKSLAQNYKDAAAAIHSMAFNSTQFKKNMDSVTIATANVPAVAAKFADATAATLASQRVAKVAQDAINVGKGINVKINASDIVSQLRQAGVQGSAALRASLDAILARGGVGKSERIKIEAQVLGTSAIDKLKAELAALHGKNVTVTATANAAAVNALMNAINAVHSKSVTVTVTTINRMITQYIGATTPAGSPALATLVGGGPGIRITRQTGGMVPGTGFGDIVPAMLEPGEAIVPRYLVPLVAPILAAHRVPGFGGMPRNASSHFADGGIAGFPKPFHDMFPQPLGGHTGNLVWTLIDEITKALKSAGAAKIAQALVSKIGQEVALAKNVSAAAMQGQGFGNAGLIGGMDPTQGSVADQLASYLKTVKSFSGDIAALRKGHLNKAIIAQLIGAGPVAGDALAQNILTGGGTSGSSIGQLNSLWAQLGGATRGLGAQAAMAQFGGTLAPNLKSGSFTTNNVSINISAGGGATLALSDSQIKTIVAKVQAELLKQAQRNRQTGVQLAGKGA